MSTLAKLIEYMSRNKMQTAILAALVTLIGLVGAIRNQMQSSELAAERVRALDREAQWQSIKSANEYMGMYNSMAGYQNPGKPPKSMFNGVDWSKKKADQPN